MNDPPSPESDIQRGWTTKASTSMSWTETHWSVMRKSALPEINLKLILCALRLKMVIEII